MCYVYGLYSEVYEDGKTKYIGITSNLGRRLEEHKRDGRNEHIITRKAVGIREVWSLGGEIRMHVFHEVESRVEAGLIETEYIVFMGRDSLWNSTNGGEGTVVGRRGWAFRNEGLLSLLQPTIIPTRAEYIKRVTQQKEDKWKDFDINKFGEMYKQMYSRT